MTSVGLSERIAGYRLDELAGRGGMGVVYRATDLARERTVAVKVIAPALASDPVFRERFQREARLLAAIDHPHVIPFYEADEADGQLFLSMRWVEGCDLADTIQASGGLDPPRALNILRQIAGALDVVHAHGLVHRDLKPGNVLIEDHPDGEHVYLTDFGAGRQLDVPSNTTGTGQWLGSVDYVAPETLAGCPADVHSDVYALGCLLFEALAGAPPFHRDTPLATLWAHQREPVPSVCARRPALPVQVDAVLARVLAKDPDVRYQTAKRLAEAFGDALQVARGTETLSPQPAQSRPADRVRVVPGDSKELLSGGSPEPAPAAQPVTQHRRRRDRAFAGLACVLALRRPRLPAFRRRLIAAPVLATGLLLLVSQLAGAPPGRTSHTSRETGAIASVETHYTAVAKALEAPAHKQIIHRQRPQPHGGNRPRANRATHAAGSLTGTGAPAAAQTPSSSMSSGSTYTASPVTTPVTAPVTTATPSTSSTARSNGSAGRVGGPSGSAPFGPGYPGG